MLELKIMKEVHCEYIVSLLGEFINGGYINLVLEFMDKKTLENLMLKVKYIPEEILIIFAKQILLGINYLHSEKHIIHRDIKSSNILINSEGFVNCK